MQRAPRGYRRAVFFDGALAVEDFLIVGFFDDAVLLDVVRGFTAFVERALVVALARCGRCSVTRWPVLSVLPADNRFHCATLAALTP